MESRDLRIGNWVSVLHPATGEWNYEEVKGKTIANMSNNPDHPLIQNNFKPIPLSPSILEKAGAIKGNRDWDYTISVGALKMHFRRFADTWYSELGEIYLGDRIQYVHQLQNIYHSIHGTELTLNL